jgi:hypothetical protein
LSPRPEAQEHDVTSATTTAKTSTAKTSTAPRWRGVPADERRRKMARLGNVRTWAALKPRITLWLAHATPEQVAELRARLDEWARRR